MKIRLLQLLIAASILAGSIAHRAAAEPPCMQEADIAVNQFLKKFEGLSASIPPLASDNTASTDENYHGPWCRAIVTIEFSGQILESGSEALISANFEGVFGFVEAHPSGVTPCSGGSISISGTASGLVEFGGCTKVASVYVFQDKCSSASVTLTRLSAVVVECGQTGSDGCASCGGAPGGVAASPLAAFDFTPVAAVPFGMSNSLTNERPQPGVFTMMYGEPNATLFTPKVLGYLRRSGDVETIFSTNIPPYIRQVRAVDGLADVVVISTNQYEVRIYHPTNVLTKDASGFWQVTNAPMRTVTFQNANPTDTNACELFIVRAEAGVSVTNHYCYVQTNHAWTLTGPDGLAQRAIGCVFTNGNTLRTDTHVVCQTNTGAVSHQEIRRYTNYSWGIALVERRVSPGLNELWTAYEYYTGTNDPGYGRIKKTTYAGGDWAYLTYDSSGRQKERYGSFQNAAFTTDTNLCRYSIYDYTPISGAGDAGSKTNEMRMRVDWVLGREVSLTYWVYMADGTKEIRCTTAGAAWNDDSNLVTTTQYYTNGSYSGWLATVLAPDGAFTLYEYATNGTTRTNVVWQGEPNSGYTAVIGGTKTVTVLGGVGEVLSVSTYDVASGLLVNSDIYGNFDQGKSNGVRSVLLTFKEWNARIRFDLSIVSGRVFVPCKFPADFPNCLQVKQHGAHDDHQDIRLPEPAGIDLVPAERRWCGSHRVQLRLQRRQPAHPGEHRRRVFLDL